MVGAIAKFGSFNGDGFFVAYPLFLSRLRKDLDELKPARFFEELKMLYGTLGARYFSPAYLFDSFIVV